MIGVAADRSGAYFVGPRAVADLDADGDLDVVATGVFLPDAKVNALLNDGTGVFSLAGELSSNPAPGRSPDHQAHEIEAVDLDADRLPDLVMNTPVGLVIVWNAGGGRLEPFQTLPVAGTERVSGLTVGDLEGDGDLDVLTILYQLKGRDQLAIVRNEGSRRLPPPELTVSNLEHAGAIASGDVEGDGVLDIVLSGSGRVTLLHQAGDHLDQSRTYRSGVSPHEVLVGDVDGDGRRDLALTRPGDEMGGEAGKTKLRVLYNRGEGRFSRPAKVLDDPLARAKVTDDLNGDGRLDITMGDSFYLSAPRGPGATCL